MRVKSHSLHPTVCPFDIFTHQEVIVRHFRGSWNSMDNETRLFVRIFSACNCMSASQCASRDTFQSAVHSRVYRTTCVLLLQSSSAGGLGRRLVTGGLAFTPLRGISFVDCPRDEGSPEGVATTFYTPHDVDPLYNSRQGRDDDAEPVRLATISSGRKALCELAERKGEKHRANGWSRDVQLKGDHSARIACSFAFASPRQRRRERSLNQSHSFISKLHTDALVKCKVFILATVN